MRVANEASPYFAQACQSFAGLPMAELGALTAILRAANAMHQSHHWRTAGPSYYGDHILFERLYEDSQLFIDQMAEKAMGLGHPDLVCPVTQMEVMSVFVNAWSPEDRPSADEMVAVSLATEKCVVGCLNAARESLDAKGTLTNGLDNLIQGVADKHEEFLYLLQQRAGGRVAYTYRR